MLILALDTSTRQSSIALCSESELYGEYTWLVGNNHSVELLGSIQRLCAESRITLAEIDAIAVATGPGSFNGLRVALATAKTLAFSLQKILLGVSTLELIAAQQAHWHGPICALLEAGRSELYAACYKGNISKEGESSIRVERLSDYLLLPPHQLATALTEQMALWFDVEQGQPFLFCGEIREASYQALYEQLRERSLFVRGVQASRRASTLAMLAFQRLQDGEKHDPLTLEPLYLRRPSITTSTRKQPLLGGVNQ